MVILLEAGARIAVLLTYGRQDKGFHHIFNYEPFLGVRSNERFRMTHPRKGSNTFRILILGGSTADQLSTVSQELLASLFSTLTARPLEFINFAQAGAISSQEAIMLARHGLRLKPDLVIALDGVNDLVTMTKGMPPGVPYTDAYIQLAMNHPFLNLVHVIGRHSQFLNVVRKLHERRQEKALQSDAGTLDLTVAEYILNESAMDAMTRGIRARFVTVLQPYIDLRRRTNAADEEALGSMMNYTYRREFMINAVRRLRAELAGWARDENAVFVDGTSAFDESTEDCFRDAVHLTGRGLELLLRHIARELVQKQLAE